MNYAEKFKAITCLQGCKVGLKPVRLKIAGEMFGITKESEKELYQYMPWQNRTVEDAKRFIRLSMKQCREGTALNHSIHEKESGRLVGTIGIHHFDPFTPSCEVGYWIKTADHGKGFAIDALATLLKFCRNELSLVRIDARTAAQNIASQKVLLKCGFVEEGFKKKAELCHGTWHDLKLFGIILQ